MRTEVSAGLLLVALAGCRSAGPGLSAAPPVPPAPPAPASAPAPVAAAVPPAEPYRNNVRWSTASELDNFGFDVYRGTSVEGPFERLTHDPIPGAGTSDVPHNYAYRDEAIDPHQAYYYYVEAISLSGKRERFTPVIRAKPKVETAAPAPPPGP